MSYKWVKINGKWYNTGIAVRDLNWIDGIPADTASECWRRMESGSPK